MCPVEHFAYVLVYKNCRVQMMIIIRNDNIVIASH